MYGPLNGDFGIVFERTCDSSNVRERGCDRCQLQRMLVPAPSRFAMPSSSPAGGGVFGMAFSECWISD